MLTREMRGTISLLKEISYMQGYVVCEQSLPEACRIEACGLLDCLCRSGLLRIIEPLGEDQLCFRYALCRPLSGITLYDILRITGGDIHLSLNPCESLADSCGIVGHRLDVANDMVCRLFSEISVVEIVLPEGAGVRK